MVCDKCGEREGSVTVISALNGVKQKSYLCRECYANFQFLNLLGFGGADLSVGLAEREIVLRCARCGTSAEEFLETSFVGCPLCYEAFAPIMPDILKKCQFKPAHTGKTPSGRKNNEYETLRQQLETAITEERYEDAAAIKRRLDEIRA